MNERMYGGSGTPNDQNQPGPQPNQSNPQQPQPQPQNPQPAQNAQAAQTQQQSQKKQQSAIGQLKSKEMMGMLPLLVVGIVIFVIIIAAVAFVLTGKGNGNHTTTINQVTSIPATTTATQTTKLITGCTQITSPGTYYLNKKLNVTLGSGPCINIKSSNVELIGDQNRLVGSGPYSIEPPYTYGIYIANVSNVSVNGVSVSAFSYGIYLKDAKGVNLALNNVSSVAMSSIYLNGSSQNVVVNNTISRAAGPQGGIAVVGGGSNKVDYNVFNNNAEYGITINSTGNHFDNDVFNNNPVDLYCSLSAGRTVDNAFLGSSCITNHYCNFAQCYSVNLPTNIQSVVLGSTVQSCGGIYTPGVYTLDANLDMGGYLNTSNPLAAQQACVTILTSSVTLNCRGHTISNGGYGVDASNQFNTTIENCIFLNDTTAAVAAVANLNIKVINNTALGGKYGFLFTNQTAGEVLNTTAARNTYGFYLDNIGAISFSGFNSSLNGYGIYLNRTNSSTFQAGKLAGNAKTDLYCSANTYNRTQFQFSGVSCGTTDCNWGNSCKTKQKPPISITPINSCYNFTASGVYSLQGYVIGGDKCMHIYVSGVTLNCNNNVITGSLTGVAVYLANGVSNVTVNGCKIGRYRYGIISNHSSDITLVNNNVTGPVVGVELHDVQLSKVSSNRVINSNGNGAFLFQNVTNSTISDNNAFDGIGGSSGYVMNGSTDDIVSFNNAKENAGYGFWLNASSYNTVFNNSAFNNALDYGCGSSNSGLYSENGGINQGSTKQNCKWLIVLNPVKAPQSCLALTASQDISLDSDMIYAYGGTCFSIYGTPRSNANNSIINCNYHTVAATKGGTFVNIINSSNVEVENCYIKNFTNGVLTRGNYALIQNNTFATVANTAIGIYGSRYPRAVNNIVLNSSFGMALNRDIYANFSFNHIISSNNSMEFNQGSVLLISNNTASGGSEGATLVNNTIDTLQKNAFNGVKYGIACLLGSQLSTSLNKDNGGNVCNINLNCTWMGGASRCNT
ncbi:MAG: right-handed parallel beta-helix repeat-containing protein [Candidatus Micrarchaeota archaeon]|nr:right-handed parallel beta-helix repeat-containing protein [Candidatus Micrarchaeota archaeon]MDE1847351.1 right-handed parallel beta-helix repeat-containing protein [Candidatus Micrarchaeota archaeon]MDE1863966.1 right-handed parallel beta-helix repeat-containing protein [Candidatus Micrarchaeota archaeon]